MVHRELPLLPTTVVGSHARPSWLHLVRESVDRLGPTVDRRGPGVVLGCRACTHVAVVVTEVRGIKCVDISGFRTLEMPHG